MAQGYPALVPQGKLLGGVPIGLPVPLLTSWFSLKVLKKTRLAIAKLGKKPGPDIRMIDWRLSLDGQHGCQIWVGSDHSSHILCTFHATAKTTQWQVSPSPCQNSAAWHLSLINHFMQLPKLSSLHLCIAALLCVYAVGCLVSVLALPYSVFMQLACVSP